MALTLILAAPAGADARRVPAGHQAFLTNLRALMASMQEESRADAERIERAYRSTVWLLPDRAALFTAREQRTIVPVPLNPSAFNLAPRLRGPHPIGEKDLENQWLYVAGHPGALGLLAHVALRMGEVPLDVTSLVRHLEYQQRLVRTNPNARTSLPMHASGLAFDVSVLNIPLSATRRLASVLRQMRDAGDLYFIAERQQLVFHVVPAPERLEFYAHVFRGLASAPPISIPRPDPIRPAVTGRALHAYVPTPPDAELPEQSAGVMWVSVVGMAMVAMTRRLLRSA